MYFLYCPVLYTSNTLESTSHSFVVDVRDAGRGLPLREEMKRIAQQLFRLSSFLTFTTKQNIIVDRTSRSSTLSPGFIRTVHYTLALMWGLYTTYTAVAVILKGKCGN